jgi:hypothetical protein
MKPASGTTSDEHALSKLDTARLLMLGLWLGAAVFFSFAVAPAVFGVLTSREMAGQVVQRTLVVINVGGFAIGLVTLLLLMPARARLRPFWFWAEALLLAVMAAATAVGHWVIAAHLHGLRVQFGRPVDLVPPDDPLRIAFGQWHGYSVIVLTVAMVAALAAWLLIARHTRISGSHK